MHRPRFNDALRAGLIFGVIEGITPVIGWLLGRAASSFVQQWDHWIALVLLSALGLRMIYAGMGADPVGAADELRGRGFWMLAVTGFATSIDAMVVGVGLSLLHASIAIVAPVIGLCTFVMVTIGIMLGRVLGTLIGKRAEIAGGVVLIIVGVMINFAR